MGWVCGLCPAWRQGNCVPGWLWSWVPENDQIPPVSTSWALRVQVCLTMPCLLNAKDESFQICWVCILYPPSTSLSPLFYITLAQPGFSIHCKTSNNSPLDLIFRKQIQAITTSSPRSFDFAVTQLVAFPDRGWVTYDFNARWIRVTFSSKATMFKIILKGHQYWWK